MSAVTNKRIFPHDVHRLTEKMQSTHFAGNGRIVTACGELRPLPSAEEWRQVKWRDKGVLMLKAHKFASSRPDPKCKQCRLMLSLVKDLDPKALVATGEFDKPNALAKATFQVEAAKAMVERLDKLTPGWKARVWENLGYHWEVFLGTMHLYPSEDVAGSYGDILRPAGSYHVIFDGHWCASAKSPEACIREALLAARNEATALIGRVFDARLNPFDPRGPKVP